MAAKRIAVGLSGGVDSAVTAALLVREGHEVVGVTMRIWDGRPLPAEDGRHACYGPGEAHDIEDGEKIAQSLGIPFHVVDLADDYNERVLDYCQDAYLTGETPNPCTRCNARVKLELIPERLRQQKIDTDFFATGHYAIVEKSDNGRFVLARARDRHKDQSYFLYQLSQQQLGRTLFPLGTYDKTEVRRLASELNLPVADKAESQDFVAGGYHILFGGNAKPGAIVDAEGRVLGEHQGVQFYTIGQRRGLGIAAPHPLYVTAIDAANNAVVVGPAEDLLADGLVARDLNWIAIDDLREPIRVEARIRYRHKEASAVITPASGGEVKVEFEQPQQAVTPGQAVVFYDGERVIGGGIIARRL